MDLKLLYSRMCLTHCLDETGEKFCSMSWDYPVERHRGVDWLHPELIKEIRKV
jgi:hypothetical protein